MMRVELIVQTCQEKKVGQMNLSLSYIVTFIKNRTFRFFLFFAAKSRTVVVSMYYPSTPIPSTFCFSFFVSFRYGLLKRLLLLKEMTRLKGNKRLALELRVRWTHTGTQRDGKQVKGGKGCAKERAIFFS